MSIKPKSLKVTLTEQEIIISPSLQIKMKPILQNQDQGSIIKYTKVSKWEFISWQKNIFIQTLDTSEKEKSQGFIYNDLELLCSLARSTFNLFPLPLRVQDPRRNIREADYLFLPMSVIPLRLGVNNKDYILQCPRALACLCGLILASGNHCAWLWKNVLKRRDMPFFTLCLHWLECRCNGWNWSSHL